MRAAVDPGGMDDTAALGRDPPERDGDRADLPRWVAPLPTALEDIAYRFVWPIVVINLLGTAFGFWYYRFQFQRVPAEMWLFVPDSPGATLLIALALAAWAVSPSSTLEASTSLAQLSSIEAAPREQRLLLPSMKMKTMMLQ